MPDAKIESLNSEFVTGNIPTEGDFKYLIDVVAQANTALSLVENSQAVAGMGGVLAQDNRLQIVTAAECGLQAEAEGLKIVPGEGLSVDEQGLHLKVGNGLAVSDKKLHIAPWPGLRLEGSTLKIATGSGLMIADESVKVNHGDGLALKDKQLGVNLPTTTVGSANASGLLADEHALRVNVVTADEDIIINSNNQLTLTDVGLNVLIDKSSKKFQAALAASQESGKKGLHLENTGISLSKGENWKTPITAIIAAAHDYGVSEITRARTDLQSQLKIFLSGQTAPTYDNLRINFSALKKDSQLYYGTGAEESFAVETLHDIISPQVTATMTPEAAKKPVNKATFGGVGYHAFIGKVSGQDNKASAAKDGTHLTANAVMVYIGELDTLAIGFWDLVGSDAPVWYQNEADPADPATH